MERLLHNFIDIDLLLRIGTTKNIKNDFWKDTIIAFDDKGNYITIEVQYEHKPCNFLRTQACCYIWYEKVWYIQKCMSRETIYSAKYPEFCYNRKGSKATIGKIINK